MKIGLSTSMVILLLVACSANQERRNFNKRQDNSQVFKQWVRDTLPQIQISDSLFSSDIFVSDDTALLDIRKRYSVKVSPFDTQNNLDLLLAINLLKDEKLIPQKIFQLNLSVTHTYTSTPTNNKYDYSFEINKFEVITDKQTINLSYVKGNLIEKKFKKKE